MAQIEDLIRRFDNLAQLAISFLEAMDEEERGSERFAELGRGYRDTRSQMDQTLTELGEYRHQLEGEWEVMRREYLDRANIKRMSESRRQFYEQLAKYEPKGKSTLYTIN